MPFVFLAGFVAGVLVTWVAGVLGDRIPSADAVAAVHPVPTAEPEASPEPGEPEPPDET